MRYLKMFISKVNCEFIDFNVIFKDNGEVFLSLCRVVVYYMFFVLLVLIFQLYLKYYYFF